MTAEIAVMNKIGIALATDSAVTIGNAQKIYNTSNKLFMLSSFHPVGIMIYANSEFMKIPWETIIKDYRKFLGNREYPNLEDYYNSFLKFLVNPSNKLFEKKYADQVLSNFLYSIAHRRYEQILKHFEHLMKEKFTEKTPLSEKTAQTTFHELINDKFISLSKKTDLSEIKIIDLKRSIPKFNDAIDTALTRIFQKFPITPNDKIILKKIPFLVILKEWNNYTGIVIAGFGKEQSFPTMIAVRVDGLYNGKIKKEITVPIEPNSVGIYAFAQNEMVARFISGIDPKYKSKIIATMSEILRLYSDNFKQIIAKSKLKTRANTGKVLEDTNKSLIEKLSEYIDDFEKQEFKDPITDNIGNLPKEELAVMAETLVNITLFKRRVSINEFETVGGPIDVALISKGDGFVWIKRKHYFQPELNPHFFKRIK